MKSHALIASFPSRPTERLGAVLLAICLFAGTPARAQFTSWTTPGSGNWFTASNWDNGLPVAGWIVTVGDGVSGTAQISFGTGYAQDIILGTTAAGTLTVDNGGTVAPSGFLELGRADIGTFNLMPTGTLRVSGTDGIRAGAGTALFNFSGGTIYVADDDLGTSVPMSLSGTTSTVNVSNGLNAILSGALTGTGSLAKSGTGTLILSGSNSFSGATNVKNGSLTVTGGNTSTGMISVGDSSAANLSVLAGSQLTSTADVNVNVGNVVVSGSNSRLAAGGNLTVGNTGAATLTIGNGSSLSVSGYLALTDAASGVGTVNVAGTLEVGGTNGIRVGSGTGALNFTNGTLKVIGSDLTTSVPQSLQTATIDTNGLGATLSAANSIGELDKIGSGVLSLSATNSVSKRLSVKQGTLEVSGSAATLAAVSTSSSNPATIEIGVGDTGVLSVSNGAHMNMDSGSFGVTALNLGVNAGSSGTLNVDGSGSSVQLSGVRTDVTIGGNGAGTVNITNGAQFLVKKASPFNQGVIAVGNSSSGGSINVSGAGSLFQSESLYPLVLGNNGPGTINVSSGGAVSSTAGITVGNNAIGTINIGPAGTLSSRLTKGAASGSVNLAGGTLITVSSNVPTTLAAGTNSTIKGSSISAPISGSGSVTIGSGVTGFSGTHTYTGTTTIGSGGDLYLSGSSITSDVTIQQNGILRGGTMQAITLQNGGLIAQRSSMTANSLLWDGGGQIYIPLTSVSTATYVLTLNGMFEKGANGTFLFQLDFRGAQAGKTYDLINFSGTDFAASDFSFVSAGPNVDGTFSFDPAGDTLRFTLTAIPEPSVWVLLLMGAAAVFFQMHRSKNRAGRI